MSSCRQNYAPECEVSLNKQINVQLYTAYAYTGLAWHCNRSDIALPGLHKFFQIRANASRQQAKRLMAYQTVRGGQLILADIGKPPAPVTVSSSTAVGLQLVQQALEMEKTVNAALLQLHSIGDSAGDAHFLDFIEGECLDAQASCLKRLSDLASQLAQCGQGLGEFAFDRELLHDQSDYPAAMHRLPAPAPPSAALLSDDSNSQPPVDQRQTMGFGVPDQLPRQQQQRRQQGYRPMLTSATTPMPPRAPAAAAGLYSAHINEEVSRAKLRDTMLRMLRRSDILIAAAESQLKQIELERVRFDRACYRSQRSFRYTLRLRMAVLEGMCNMLREYATTKMTERNNFAAIVRAMELEMAGGDLPSPFYHREEGAILEQQRPVHPIVTVIRQTHQSEPQQQHALGGGEQSPARGPSRAGAERSEVAQRIETEGLDPLVLLQLESLNFLSISKTALEQLPTPDGGIRLPALAKLCVYENRLAALPATFAQLATLKHLDLSNNRLVCLPDNLLTDLLQLEVLNLSNNQLESLPRLGPLSHLLDMYLSNNRLTALPDEAPQVQSEAPQVQSEAPQVQSESPLPAQALPPSLSRLPCLRVLDLENNRVTRVASRRERLRQAARAQPQSAPRCWSTCATAASRPGQATAKAAGKKQKKQQQQQQRLESETGDGDDADEAEAA
uniref:Ferritin n=1 Tax=Macrostomum lignano TaxID=282301 RepID=A0A1I8JMX5_9PLAT